MFSKPSNTNAKEIYPCDYGNVGSAVSVLLALIARIDFLSINESFSPILDKF